MQQFRGKKAAFLKSLRATYAVAPAADQAGVHRCTVYRWMETDADFRAAVHDAREACLDDIEARHFAAAKDKCTLSRIHLLKSHRRGTYGDPGKGAVECQQWQPEPLTPAQMKKSLEAMLNVFREEGLLAKPVQEANAEIAPEPTQTCHTDSPCQSR